MRWVVDGNNVMGARPDGWWRDRRGAAARLAGEIDRWQAARGEPVVLVFDGRLDDAVSDLRRPGFDVIGAAGPGAGGANRLSADDVIAELVGGEASGAGGAEGAVVVITSDRGLRDRLPATVRTEGAAAFLRRLAETRSV